MGWARAKRVRKMGRYLWMIACIVLCVANMAGAAETAAVPSPALSQPDNRTLSGREDPEPQRIIVTATRIPTPIENVAESVTAFTGSTPGSSGQGKLADGQYSAGDFEVRQYRNLSDVMANVPGFTFYNNGGPGTTGDYYTRGMASANTQVLLDGMPQLDASGTEGHFYFGLLQLDNISQLEVMRGPNSVLYGSNASAGVINMTSRKGEGPLSGYFSTEGGSRGSAKIRLGAQAGNEKGDFSFGGSLFRTDGYDMNQRPTTSPDRDGYKYGNGNLRLGWNATDALRFDLFTNYLKAKVEVDGGVSDHPDDENDISRFMIRPQVTLTLFDGRWEQSAGIGYIGSDRYYEKPHDLTGPSTGNSKFLGETYKFDYQSIFRLTGWNSILAGIDVVTDSMVKKDLSNSEWVEQNTGSVTTTAVYLEDHVNVCDTFFATLGLRQLHHDDFGDKAVWKASAMYVLPTDTRIKTSAGTGFNAPYLIQLYMGYDIPGMGTTYPNSALKPEQTTNWDIGFEQSLWEKRILFGSTYFWNKAKDKIEYSAIPGGGGASSYFNINNYRTWGFESFLQIALTDNLKLSGQYTWMEVKSDQISLTRNKPESSASANIDWNFLDKGTLTAGVNYVGKRKYSARVDMPSYTLFRVGASWKVTDKFEIFGRVENLFDKKYVQRYSYANAAGTIRYPYGTEGRSFYAGAAISF